jgi:hypothetical protein
MINWTTVPGACGNDEWKLTGSKLVEVQYKHCPFHSNFDPTVSLHHNSHYSPQLRNQV